MPNSAEAVIHRVTALDLKVEPFDWPFARARRADIDAHFAIKKREKPIWNGRVLLAHQPSFEGERFSARYFPADFASFLAWRDWGFPDRQVFNGFAVGALRCSDGAFVLAEMAAHTANAGRVYFPAGTPDLDDVVGDSVDMAGSVIREIEEETGLTAADYRAAPYWDCVVAGAAIALIRPLSIDLPGEVVRGRIEANLSRQANPELSAIHLVRSRNDLRDNMPRSVTAFIEQELNT